MPSDLAIVLLLSPAATNLQICSTMSGSTTGTSWIRGAKLFLDRSRNQDDGNSGLGLAIARDIAKSHGGDITLGESSIGGLRAIISVPL